MSPLMLVLGAVLVLLFVARRFLRHRESLTEYRERKQREHEAQVRQIHQANAGLDLGDALGPVAAGLREMAAERGVPLELALDGRELVVWRPSLGTRETPALRVVWLVRAVRVPSTLYSHEPRLGGHWELHLPDQPAQPFTDLEPLMHRMAEELELNAPE